MNKSVKIPVPARLRARRKRLGLTQSQAAARAGITQAHWSHVERGQLNPSWTTLDRMAAALGLSSSSLLSGRGCRAPEEQAEGAEP